MAFVNPVLRTVERVVEDSTLVSINYNKLKALARRYYRENLELPKWDAPVFPNYATDETIDFLMTGCAINFQYMDFQTKARYKTEYNSIPFTGAFGMWADLKRAVEEGVTVLDGKYLAHVKYHELYEKVFKGRPEIPMLETRTIVLREVGEVLVEKYGGHFHNLYRQLEEKRSQVRIFDNGNGFIERVTTDFRNFRDTGKHGNRKVIFNKKAQLATAMVYEKFLAFGKELFPAEDTEYMTVFANYELPKIFNMEGVLIYDPGLANKIENGIVITYGKREEVEIRANTIWAAKILQDEITKLRHEKNKVNALHVDYKLWMEGRKYKEKLHHFTPTDA